MIVKTDPVSQQQSLSDEISSLRKKLAAEGLVLADLQMRIEHAAKKQVQGQKSEDLRSIIHDRSAAEARIVVLNAILAEKQQELDALAEELRVTEERREKERLARQLENLVDARKSAARHFEQAQQQLNVAEEAFNRASLNEQLFRDHQRHEAEAKARGWR